MEVCRKSSLQGFGLTGSSVTYIFTTRMLFVTFLVSRRLGISFCLVIQWLPDAEL